MSAELRHDDDAEHEHDYDADERVHCSGCGDHLGERAAECEARQLREFREQYGPYGMGGLE